MIQNIFRLEYNVSGEERKRLIRAVAECTGAQVRYLFAPTFAYEVDYFHIDKNGCVSFDDRADSEEIERLIEFLAERGFIAAAVPDSEEAQPEPSELESNGTDTPLCTGLEIKMPLGIFGPDTYNRLTKLIGSKATLIRKALGADRISVYLTSDTICFPWWNRMPESEEIQAYSEFIAALCQTARNSKRVTAVEHDTQSEKYTFRNFLMHLGFGGAEHKETRRILLKNLTGSSAFPNTEKAQAFAEKLKAQREAKKTAKAAGTYSNDQ